MYENADLMNSDEVRGSVDPLKPVSDASPEELTVDERQTAEQFVRSHAHVFPYR